MWNRVDYLTGSGLHILPLRLHKLFQIPLSLDLKCFNLRVIQRVLQSIEFVLNKSIFLLGLFLNLLKLLFIFNLLFPQGLQLFIFIRRGGILIRIIGVPLLLPNLLIQLHHRLLLVLVLQRIKISPLSDRTPLATGAFQRFVISMLPTSKLLNTHFTCAISISDSLTHSIISTDIIRCQHLNTLAIIYLRYLGSPVFLLLTPADTSCTHISFRPGLHRDPCWPLLSLKCAVVVFAGCGGWGGGSGGMH